MTVVNLATFLKLLGKITWLQYNTAKFGHTSCAAFKGIMGLLASGGGKLNMNIGSKQKECQSEAKPSHYYLILASRCT